jgi:CRP-like cAMP-binding protein
MANAPRKQSDIVHDHLLKTVERYMPLTLADETALRSLKYQIRVLEPQEDVVSQGERPDVSVYIMNGALARYHTVANGDRQFLSLHISKDLPDVQALFLKIMDHSVCALIQSEIVVFRHEAILPLLTKRPNLCFALWRITLVDAAIFRQAITNNSARPPEARIAHFCCEIFVRSRDAGLASEDSCGFPLTQTQLGQMLGVSIVTVNRALQGLRSKRLLDVRDGQLFIKNWRSLVRLASFDDTYLHIAQES